MLANGTVGTLLSRGVDKAASLVSWQLEGEMRGGLVRVEIEAELTDINTYFIRQAPMTVMLNIRRANWVWHNVELSVDGHRCTMQAVGKPQRQ